MAILRRFGKDFTWELKAKMMGKKAAEAAEVMIAELGLEGQLDPQEFIAEREAMLHELFPHSELMPGAERLIRHLHACGVPMAVATSSHRRHFDLKTSRHGELFGLFDAVVTGDAVRRGKPDPEIFHVAAGRVGFAGAAPRCLVLEDAPVGIAAANAAGMRSVLVPDPNLSLEGVPEPTATLKSLSDFDPAFWGLPAFPAC